MTAEPNIYAYLDYRRWLSDWFDAKKKRSPRYSHRAFVRRTGQRSPSLLADVVAGRRNLTPRGLEGFERALDLNANDSAFFRDLVSLDQANTTEERAAAGERIAATRHFREARSIDGASIQYLSKWYLPAIKELATCDGFRPDPAWIASMLRPKITEAQARDGLRDLLELGLLVPHDDGTLQAAQVAVVTPHQMASAMSFSYHRGMLERAQQSLASSTSAERHFVGLTASIPEALLPDLKNELNQLQVRLLELCDRADRSDRVVQINLHFFPLTKPVEEVQ